MTASQRVRNVPETMRVSTKLFSCAAMESNSVHIDMFCFNYIMLVKYKEKAILFTCPYTHSSGVEGGSLHVCHTPQHHGV